MRKLLPLMLAAAGLGLTVSTARALCLRPDLYVGGGYYLNNADFIFPQETRGRGPLLTLSSGVRPRPLLWCGLQADYSWCRHDFWVHNDPAAAITSIDFRGALNVLNVQAAVRYSETVPASSGLSFFIQGGLGLMYYHYQFSALGQGSSAADFKVDEKKSVCCPSIGLGMEKTLCKKMRLFLAGSYLFPQQADGAPDLSGFAVAGGLGCR